jgi:hypothetical protein
MEFIQIIEYKTSKPDEVAALGEDFRAQRMNGEDGTPPIQVIVVKDRDREGTYQTIVHFSSYEEAMENSQRPETGEFASQMAALCDGPPTFYNLDVVMKY